MQLRLSMFLSLITLFLHLEDASFNVRNELLAYNPNNKVVVSWMGDPCLPLPWDGLFCESRDNSSVIIKL